jgi:superfamily II DNA or RNA helicase
VSFLQRPDPELVTSGRAAAVLRRMGLDWAAEVGVLEPIPPVVPLSPRDPTEWWVGQAAVVSCQQANNFPGGSQWACDCTPMVPARCVHVATAVLVHAWNRADMRGLFDQPTWSLALEPLMAPEAPEEGPPPGYLTYRLVPGGVRSGIPVERERVRLSRKDGRVLRPGPVPDTLGELETSVAHLTPADRTFHRAVELSTFLLKGAHRNPLEPAVARLVAELQAEAMACLLTQSELDYGDGRVRVDPTPLQPVLRVVDEGDHLVLTWATPVLETFDFGPGYVVTTDETFRPLVGGIDPSVLSQELPKVPVAEATRFIDHFIRKAGVGLALESAHLPPTFLADGVEGRIELAEGDDALEVRLTFGYLRGGDAAVVEGDDPRPYLDLAGGLAAREPRREAALAERVRAALGRPAPTLLHGDQALDFLLDGGAALGPGFRFFGDVDLARHRVVGRLQASVHVPSGQDWFDLRVTFTTDAGEVSADQVLASWVAGRRYVELPDGALARLPDAWLERFGQTARQIEALRKASGGTLPAYAAPLLAELGSEVVDAPWQDLLEKLIHFRGIPDAALPTNLTVDLRSYQVAGFRWLRFLRQQGLGGCLADDMGLGKTVQTLAVLLDAHNEGPGHPTLVVAPTSVVPNWATEAGRFAPDLRVVVHHGPERGSFAEADLVITSYALLRLDADRLLAQEWRYVVLDEAQQIKNPHSQVARVARGLKAQHRLALTGTPLENHLLELWSIFEFLMPGYFGTTGAFQRDFAVPVQRDRDPVAAAALRRRIRPFLLRRLKSEVATELPPRTEQTLYCELGPEQRALYDRVKATCRATVMAKVAEVGVKRATLSVLEALMRLRQACCDPALLPFAEADSVQAAAKLELLEETLSDLVAGGHRTLVFSQWPSLLRRVIPRLDARGWSYLYLDGRTRERADLVTRWNDPEGPPVFLVSLKAGGTGLNLTGADHVIHLDPWWNPAAEDQATDRAHRIGQDKPVMAYKLVARDTVEEKILELQQRKRALFTAAVDTDRLVVESLTRADLEAVFGDEDGSEVMAPLEPRVEVDDDEAPLPTDVPSALAALLRPGACLTNTHIRDATGWGAVRARRWLQIEVEAGRLEQRGSRRGTHYFVTDRRFAD